MLLLCKGRQLAIFLLLGKISSIYFELFFLILFCFISMINTSLSLLDSFPCTLYVYIGLDNFAMGIIMFLDPGCVSLLVSKPAFVCLLDLKEFCLWLQCTFNPVYCSLSVTYPVLICLSDWEDSFYAHILMHTFVNSNKSLFRSDSTIFSPSEVIDWLFC